MSEDKDNFSVNEKEYIVTVEGSLGLLAYGDVGLRAWRKVRDGEKINEKE